MIKKSRGGFVLVNMDHVSIRSVGHYLRFGFLLFNTLKTTPTRSSKRNVGRLRLIFEKGPSRCCFWIVKVVVVIGMVVVVVVVVIVVVMVVVNHQHNFGNDWRG
jgi:hypothetical protein